MPIDSNELLQALRNNGVLRNALNGLPVTGLTALMELGALVLGRNELGLYDTAADPAAFRGGSVKGGLVKFSGNVLVPWPESNGAHIHWQPVEHNGTPLGPVQHFREEEAVLLQFKQDERWTDLDPRQDRRALTGVITIHIRNGALDGDGMVKVLELGYDYLWTPWFQCGNVPGDPHAPGPVSPLLGGSRAPQARRFYSDDGAYCFNVQGDGGGKIVQYATHGSADETTWTAIGQFRLPGLPA